MTLSQSPHPNDSASRSAVPGRDRAWVAAIRRGDPAAFEAMFRAYRGDLVGFVASLLRSEPAAEDVVQELFLRIWRQREDWELAGPLNTYLFRAARNGAISRMRRERVELSFQRRVRAGAEGPVLGSARVPGADELLRARELEQAIMAAVDELPDRCREVFQLARYHRLSHAEVGQVLEISVNTVEVQMTRALAHLRKRLAEFREG